MKYKDFCGYKDKLATFQGNTFASQWEKQSIGIYKEKNDKT